MVERKTPRTLGKPTVGRPRKSSPPPSAPAESVEEATARHIAERQAEVGELGSLASVFAAQAQALARQLDSGPPSLTAAINKELRATLAAFDASTEGEDELISRLSGPLRRGER